VSEGITWDTIDFIDNEPMIELITKSRVGILPMLDEELKVPGGSDERFLKKLQEQQGKNPVMIKNIKFRNGFTVRHFAGEVPYTVDNFMDKNRDTLTEDLVDMLSSSGHKFLQQLYPKDESVSTSDRKSSLSKQFQKQLKDLMAQLYSTEPHYIRCIKPNDTKTPLAFRPRNCYEQLTYSGVFEAVAIRKKGFPFRLKHDDFVAR
jgi:myosin-7